MFEVIVDNEIADFRERAKQDDYESILFLATCLSRGNYTRANPDQALLILNYLIARKELLPFRKIYWNALIEKSCILWEKEENDAIDLLYQELIQDMTSRKPQDWNLEQLEQATMWLRNREMDRMNQHNRD